MAYLNSNHTIPAFFNRYKGPNPSELIPESTCIDSQIILTNKTINMKKKLLTLKIVAIVFLMANLIFANTTYGQVSIRSTSSASINSGSSLTIPKPAALQSGDLMIVNIAHDNTSNNPVSTGWIPISGASIGGGQISLLYKIAGSSEPPNYTFTSADNPAVGTIVAFYGVNVTGGFLVGGSAGGPFDVAPGSWNTANSSTVTANSILTNSTNAAIVMFASVPNSGPTWSNNWTTTLSGNLVQIYSNQNPGNNSVGAAWATKAVSGNTGVGSVTNSGGGSNGGILLALKPGIKTFTSVSTGNWNTPGTWDQNAVPTTSSNVIIANGHIVNLNVNSATINDLTINGTLDQGTFTVSGSGNFTLSGGLLVGGTSNFPSGFGTITLNSGSTVNYNMSGAQTISPQAYSNLTISGNNTKTLGGNLSVANVLTVSTGTTLALGANNVTLKSTASGTSQVAAVAGNITYGTGKFVIERFVLAHRAWRFLGVPITTVSAPTINASWMEGGQVTTLGGTSNPNPGYGTHITGPGAVANGLDVNPSGNSSAKYYSAGLYPGVPNSSALITSQPAYMLFVRGSRANVLTSGIYAATDNTTLRISGQLNVGTQLLSNGTAGATVLPESNPYASRIQMPHTIGGFGTTYSVWDPLLTGSNGVGAFVTYSWAGSWSSNVTPASPIQPGIIESGAAFLVQFPGISTLTLNETDKISGSAQVFNPATAPGDQIRINLSSINNDGTTSLVDGVLVNYNDIYSNAVDYYDALKSRNIAENLGILRDGKILAIERRKIITGSDSIFLNIEQMSWKNYKFDIIADNLDHPGMKAYLKDNFLGTLTPLNLNGTTTINFTVNSDPATSATGRFSIEFSAPKPFQYTNVKAYRRATDIAVEWTVDNELNMQQYVVEHSADGTNFSAIASTSPTGNAYSHVSYTAADASSFSGDNFYRVKGTSVSGKVEYTTTVKVASLKTGTSITVYPNPITGNVINLQFIGQSAGSYQVRLYSADGQVVYSTPIMVNGGNSVQAIPVNQQLAKGVYQLEVKNGANVKMSQKVIVQ